MKAVTYADRRFCAECARFFCELLRPGVFPENESNDTLPLFDDSVDHSRHPSIKHCKEITTASKAKPWSRAVFHTPAQWPDAIKWKWFVHWAAHWATGNDWHDGRFVKDHALTRAAWQMFWRKPLPCADLELGAKHHLLIKADHCNVVRVHPGLHPTL